jgi:hypothetical protein
LKGCYKKVIIHYSSYSKYIHLVVSSLQSVNYHMTWIVILDDSHGKHARQSRHACRSLRCMNKARRLHNKFTWTQLEYEIGVVVWYICSRRTKILGWIRYELGLFMWPRAHTVTKPLNSMLNTFPTQSITGHNVPWFISDVAKFQFFTTLFFCHRPWDVHLHISSQQRNKLKFVYLYNMDNTLTLLAKNTIGIFFAVMSECWSSVCSSSFATHMRSLSVLSNTNIIA